MLSASNNALMPALALHSEIARLTTKAAPSVPAPCEVRRFICSRITSIALPPKAEQQQRGGDRRHPDRNALAGFFSAGHAAAPMPILLRSSPPLPAGPAPWSGFHASLRQARRREPKSASPPLALLPHRRV